MLSFMVIFNLILHTCLSDLDMLHPSQPCTEAENNNGYNTFLSRHLRKGIPTDLDKKKWQKFITKLDSWKRKKQSFFRFSESKSVIAVCSSGGKMYKGNLCISKKSFSFFTVEINSIKKIVKRVQFQKQHVILACDQIDNRCLPVHFDENTENIKPNNNRRDCSKSKPKINTTSVYDEVFPWL
ncbi:hypothetical protein ABG768_008520 [Culter alburnus]|uniref:Uncharacterized protein n=2 Tax=Xenocypridinae TaxID=2743747 RepID=A0AAW1ZGQ3_CULAL